MAGGNERVVSDETRSSFTTTETLDGREESSLRSKQIHEVNLSGVGTRDAAKFTSDVAMRASESSSSVEHEHAVNYTDGRQSPSSQQTQSVVSSAPSTSDNLPFSLAHEIVFVALVCMAQLMTQAGLAQAIAPLHEIGATFDNASTGQLSWLPAAYSLTVGTFILPAGRWGDLYGHRRLFLVGWIFFTVWTLLAGFAAFSHSLVFFAVCRAMQGIGPSILLPNALAIFGRTYPPGKRKNMVFALFGATAPVGFILGGLFAGIFTQFVWWPWNYWVCSIAMAVCAVLVPFVIPPMPVGSNSPSFEELDVWGTLTGVSGLVLVNFAWNEAPSVGWEQSYVYALLIVGALILAIFFWIEFKIAKYPLLPKWVFNLDNNLVLGCIALGWGSFGIWVYYLWQFQGVIRGHSILIIIAQQAPSGPMGVFAAILTGLALGIIGPGWTMLCAMVAFLLGNILLAIANPRTVYWGYVFVANVIMPVGLDMSFPAGCLIMSNFMPVEKQGMAASILLVILNYSMSIVLGMAGTVESHVSNGNMLRGIRSALYLAIGLDVLGLALAAWLTWVIERRKRRQTKARAETEKPAV